MPIVKHNLVRQALKQTTSNHNETENNPYGVKEKIFSICNT